MTLVYLDAFHRPIVPGQVAAHISRSSTHIHIHPVIIRELLPEKKILVDRISKRYEGEYPNRTYIYFFRRSRLLVPEHLVIINLTEDHIRTMYSIHDEKEKEHATS